MEYFIILIGMVVGGVSLFIYNRNQKKKQIKQILDQYMPIDEEYLSNNNDVVV